MWKDGELWEYVVIIYSELLKDPNDLSSIVHLMNSQKVWKPLQSLQI